MSAFSLGHIGRTKIAYCQYFFIIAYDGDIVTQIFWNFSVNE